MHMARHLTADEVREEHVTAMGPRLGPVYNVLWNELVWLNAKWREYIELYGGSQTRLDLLNRSARFFFHMVQRALWETILLHLTRLSDEPTTGGKSNLTVLRLPALVDDEVLREELSGLVTAVTAKTKFARRWRNRVFAHTDFETALGQGAEPLENASRHDVEDSLKSIGAVLNRMHTHYLGSNVLFEPLTASATGSIGLLYVLRDGLAAEKKRHQRLREGRPDPDDIGPGRAI